MGVYAQTDFTITCEDKDVAEKVLNTLKMLKEDKNGNTFGKKLQRIDEYVYGFEESSRVQNLEYRCEEIWRTIKSIKGVKELNCPFLVEGDGIFFES